MDLPDQLTSRRVAADAVLFRIGPAHAAPDIAVGIGADAVGEAGSEAFDEDLVVGKLVAVDVESTDIRTAAMRDAGIGDIQPLLVGRKGEPVRLVEVSATTAAAPVLGSSR